MEPPLWLLIDADDTLWENNIYFERAIDEFIAYVDHAELGPEAVRGELDAVEARNVKLRGYGSASFAGNLVECYERLRARPATEAERRRLHGMTQPIRNHPIELLPDVPETLDDLGSRFNLAMVSKGDRAEQLDKLRRSGLERRFDSVTVVREKDVGCYRRIVQEFAVEPGRAWMIGNSPKSDIRPALGAGLGAVLVPHAYTWSLEMQALPEAHERFRVVERFGDLASVF